jgi:phosphate transport system substrate-binding protein
MSELHVQEDIPMKRTFLVTILMVLFGAARIFAEHSSGLVATGDHSVWVIANDVRESFVRDTGIGLDLLPELAIVGKGCAKGMLHALQGDPAVNIGLICCTMNEGELKRSGLVVYPFAKEPLAIIVNRKNPVNGLTTEQVRDIFSGKTTNWKTVGGNDEPIVVITQLHCKNYRPNWMGILDSPSKFTDKRVDIKAQPEMTKTVADFPQAIGHLEMTSIRESPERVKLLAVDGALPTSENMAKGLYPFYGPLAVTTHGEATGSAMVFIEYLRTSPRARELMEKYGMSQTR